MLVILFKMIGFIMLCVCPFGLDSPAGGFVAPCNEGSGLKYRPPSKSILHAGPSSSRAQPTACRDLFGLAQRAVHLGEPVCFGRMRAPLSCVEIDTPLAAIAAIASGMRGAGNRSYSTTALAALL